MIIRTIIIAVLLLLNFATEPGFWEFTGFTVLGLVIMFLTVLPLVGLLVVLGSGYLMFNYLFLIQDWHWLPAILLGIITSVVMGALLGGGKNDEAGLQSSGFGEMLRRPGRF